MFARVIAHGDIVLTNIVIQENLHTRNHEVYIIHLNTKSGKNQHHKVLKIVRTIRKICYLIYFAQSILSTQMTVGADGKQNKTFRQDLAFWISEFGS